VIIINREKKYVIDPKLAEFYDYPLFFVILAV